MNTKAELGQALEDFEAGLFGEIPPNALMPMCPTPAPYAPKHRNLRLRDLALPLRIVRGGENHRHRPRSTQLAARTRRQRTVGLGSLKLANYHGLGVVEGVTMARTDSDSWDLASSVGATATMVAAYRAAATNAAEPVINDPFAEPLVRAVGIDFFSRLAAGGLDSTDAGADELVFGMINVFASRTRFLTVSWPMLQLRVSAR
jgi:hypothetical protein